MDGDEYNLYLVHFLCECKILFCGFMSSENERVRGMGTNNKATFDICKMYIYTDVDHSSYEQLYFKLLQQDFKKWHILILSEKLIIYKYEYLYEYVYEVIAKTNHGKPMC